MKKCNLCLRDLPLTEFYRMTKSPDGVGYTCKECSRARSVRWNANHPDRVRENSQKPTTREAVNARRRERRRTDPEHAERIAERRRAQYQRNKDADLARAKAWRESPAGREWRAEYKVRVRDRERLRYVLRTYNLDATRYGDMVAAQENRCAVCGTEFVGFPHVDHDHACCPGNTSCGACVRGLLCPDCNHGLGRFHDDIDRLRSAVAYLTKYT